MTLKTGQKCTAIRRILVPRDAVAQTTEALRAALEAVRVGDPRRADVQMGPVVTKAQQQSIHEGLGLLRAEGSVVYEGSGIDAEVPERGAFVQPLLLQADAASARAVHDVEVFGPVATILPYDSVEEAFALVARGRGSLVTSIVTEDADLARDAALQLGASNGRLMLLNESVRAANPGHGVVVPSCTHGGPGRAGGGEELGGLRALAFYLQRTAVQGPEAVVRALAEGGAALT
jgi:3,4-dehydroadipyl-CoA semialdehyde dehydrogenase